MNRRIQEAFSRPGSPRLIAFLVAGDPDPQSSVRAVRALVEGGADIIELGIPFSDPVADGPTIQRADIRALKSGTTPGKVFEIVKKVREFSDVPIVLLTYYNPVFAMGLSRFYQEAHASGVDGILIADMPVEESDVAVEQAGIWGIDPIFMVSETTSGERLQRILAHAGGFLYLVSHNGVTGSLATLPGSAGELVEKVRAETTMPLAVGFGISTPGHAETLCRKGADAVIVGSAIVELVEQHAGEPLLMQESLASFARQMKGGPAG